MQAGAQYHQQIAKNITGWVDVGLGKNLQKYEIGAAYKFTKNVNFDLSYKYNKVSDYTLTNHPGWSEYGTKQGLYAGLQFRF